MIHPKPQDDSQQSMYRLVIAKDHHKNLFVRLSQDVLSKLVAEASQQLVDLAHSDHDEEDDPAEIWHFVPGNDDSKFLPLEIVLGELTIYASFNGGILDDSQIDTVQIPQPLLSSSWAESTRVHVRALPRVPIATRVQVDPVTVEDWELLQVHAELLEHGTLLEQLSIVYQDQRLELIPRGLRNNNNPPIDRIHVVVKEISTAVDDPSSSIWPEPSFNDHESPQESLDQGIPQFALLRNNTEIVISPKPRHNRADPTQWTCPLQILPGALDSTQLHIANASNHDPQPVLPRMPDVSPGCILVHPLSLSFSVESSSSQPSKIWLQMTSSTSTATQIRLVQVQFSIDIPEKTAG